MSTQDLQVRELNSQLCCTLHKAMKTGVREPAKSLSQDMWEFPQFRDPFLGVFVIKALLFWGLY